MDEMTDDLFAAPREQEGLERKPLADRMRPRNLDEFVGQRHLLGPGKILRESFEHGKLFSMILWGPPGCGKTALAYLLAQGSACYWISFSAVLSGVKEIREVLKEAGYQWQRHHQRTILFMDEIHRFNKAQQDAFLPHVENGEIILIGATTENPSFELNKALLSRSKVLVMNPLNESEIAVIIERALKDRERGLGKQAIPVAPEAIQFLCQYSQGDARRALNALEVAGAIAGSQKGSGQEIGLAQVEEALQNKSLYYDKAGEEHYNLISAFIKSLRGSDPDAALYWMVRMLESGEDPMFIARRMVIFASEDIGNADPMALSLAVAAKEAVHFVGLPEAALNLSQGVTYLASAPKSNASCTALMDTKRAVREKGVLPVPHHLRNAPTSLMRDLGYGKGYQYPHDASHSVVAQNYLPDALVGKVFYHPTGYGYEQKIQERLKHWRTIKSKKKEK